MEDRLLYPQSAKLEIERKFLVSSIPALAKARKKKILQYYTLVKGDRETRLRLEDGARCYLVHKAGSGMVREEEQREVPGYCFRAMKPLAVSGIIRKTRYLMPYRGATIELDVYGGKLRGLVVAEVEFPDEEAARAFVPPGWFGRELTEVKGYSNRSLAMRGLPRSFKGGRR